MDMNKLTQKSQEALAQAQSIAIGYGQTEVDGEHLLLALLRHADQSACRTGFSFPARQREGWRRPFSSRESTTTRSGCQRMLMGRLKCAQRRGCEPA